jgi:hypothetical protein
MNKHINLASRVLIIAMALAIQPAFAESDKSKSFEDGLKSSIAIPKEKESLSDDNRENSFKEIEDGMRVTMVPEPATDAMLLLGLGVLLVALGRKKTSKVS